MSNTRRTAAVIGGGPAGLMAAETLSAAGLAVTIYERMPSMGRKLLMAGRGGLNLTHSENFEPFLARYGAAAANLHPFLAAFPPQALMAWAENLGQPLFVGSSGRVFPKAMKASPLLRAWLARLTEQEVEFRLRHEWQGWNEDGSLRFASRDHGIRADVTILALGGASWPKLGSVGGWTGYLPEADISPFRPANCGFAIGWSEIFAARFSGAPLKNIAFRFGNNFARGDAMVTNYGIEGGAVYALSGALRDALADGSQPDLLLDLRPGLEEHRLAHRLSRPRGAQSAVNFLRKSVNLSPLETNLLREIFGKDVFDDISGLAARIKKLPLRLVAAQPLGRAISTAGGVKFSALDNNLMLANRPGVFAAGEMLDWEAPTGGYLLQACFATGLAAAKAALAYLSNR